MTNRPVAILPARARTDIPIPREFLTERIALIDDPAELHVTLAVFRLASESGSIPPAVSEDDVLRDGVLARSDIVQRKIVIQLTGIRKLGHRIHHRPITAIH